MDEERSPLISQPELVGLEVTPEVTHGALESEILAVPTAIVSLRL